MNFAACDYDSLAALLKLSVQFTGPFLKIVFQLSDIGYLLTRKIDAMRRFIDQVRLYAWIENHFRWVNDLFFNALHLRGTWGLRQLWLLLMTQEHKLFSFFEIVGVQLTSPVRRSVALINISLLFARVGENPHRTAISMEILMTIPAEWEKWSTISERLSDNGQLRSVNKHDTGRCWFEFFMEFVRQRLLDCVLRLK